MDTIASVEVHVNRICERLNGYRDVHLAQSLPFYRSQAENFIKELHDPIDLAEALSVPTIMMWEQWVKRIRDQVRQMTQQHRDIHQPVSRCGKEIEKHFVQEPGVLATSQQEDYKKDPRLDRLIEQHLLTTGRLEIAECLAKESGQPLDERHKKEFTEMNNILQDLANHDLQSAQCWVAQHRNELDSIDSLLPYEIVRQRFCSLLSKGAMAQSELIECARDFGQFSPRHDEDIKILCGSLLFLKHGISNSPYSHLQVPSNWTRLAQIFAHDCCALMNVSSKSPLNTIVEAGLVALPALQLLRRAMVQRQVLTAWAVASHHDELPVEVELSSECRFHSIFSCPILRQQASAHNPPMRLQCGHVISRDALNRLATQGKLKCPYCPTESTVLDAKQIFF